MEKLYKRTYWKNAPDKTTPVNAENLDNIEAGIDGLDDRVIELKSDLSDNTIRYMWESGSIKTTDGTDQQSTTRLRTSGFYPSANDIYVELQEGYRYIVIYYDSNKSFIGFQDWIKESGSLNCGDSYYYRFVFGRTDNASIDVSESKNIRVRHGEYFNAIEKNESNIMNLTSEIFGSEITAKWELGSVNASTGQNTSSKTRLRTVDYIENTMVSVKVASGYRYIVIFYDNDLNAIGYRDWNVEESILDVNASYFRLVLGRTSNEEMTTDESVNIEVVKIGSNERIKKLEEESISNNNFYATKFHEEEDALINAVLSDKDSNTITFGVITDTHNSGVSTQRSSNQAHAINSLCERIGSNFIVHLGDVIQGEESTLALNKKYLNEYWSVQHKTYIPVMYTVAHHEQYGALKWNSWLNDDTAISKSECIGIWGKTSRELNPSYSSDGASWYFDLNGVRFIGLDSACLEADPGSFSPYVLDFLSDALNGCELPVVFLSHMPSRKTVSFRNAKTLNGDSTTTATYGEGRLSVEEQLNNYSNDVLAYIHGHTHWDNIVTCDGNKFPYISVLNGYASQVDVEANGCSDGNPTSYERVVGEYSEYGFDIVNIHADTGVIKLYRFGAGSNREYTPIN